MRKLGISFVLGLVAVVLAVQTPAQSAVPVTLIKAGRLLDPRTGNVLSPAAVLIEDGKIKEVGSPSQLQAHSPAGVMPHAPERQLSSTGAMTTLPLLSTPGSMPTPAAQKWKVFFATMARHIRWARNRRTHSAFTTWQGTFGSGPRTVTTTATLAFAPTGARTRPFERLQGEGRPRQLPPS
jgi:hypothetical protein